MLPPSKEAKWTVPALAVAAIPADPSSAIAAIVAVRVRGARTDPVSLPWQWAQDEAEVFSMFWAEGKYNFTKRDVVDKQSKLRYLKQQPIVDKGP